MTPQCTICCENVAVAYRRHPALEHVSGTFQSGTMTAVVGPNGAGKSTLLKAIMGEVPLAGGSIDLEGLTIQDVAYLPQAAEIDRRFPITVADVVLLGLWTTIGVARCSRRADAARVDEALATVGLAGAGGRQVSALSVGQFQRVLFARLLLQDARVILLDEPFVAVDDRTTDDLFAVVEGWHAAGRTIIAVLHDLAQVKRWFPLTLLLARQIVGWGQTEEVLSADNLRRARQLSGQWDGRFELGTALGAS